MQARLDIFEPEVKVKKEERSYTNVTDEIKQITNRQLLIKTCSEAMNALHNEEALLSVGVKGCNGNSKYRLRSAIVDQYMKSLNVPILKEIVRIIFQAGLKEYGTTSPEKLLSDWMTPLFHKEYQNEELKVLIFCLHKDATFMYHFWHLIEDAFMDNHIFTYFDIIEPRLSTYIHDLNIRYEHFAETENLTMAKDMAKYGKLYIKSKPKFKKYILSCMPYNKSSKSYKCSYELVGKYKSPHPSSQIDLLHSQ